MTPIHSDREHVTFSPSSAARWLACPGSVRLVETVPPSVVASVYADEGTRAHELAEILLRSGDAQQVGYPDDDPEKAEMIRNLAPYLDYCQELIKYAAIWWLEMPVSLIELQPPVQMSGTADFIALSKTGSLVVVDLKYGQGVPVEVEQNKQLRYYGLAALLTVQGMPADMNLPAVNVVVTTIVQPRAPHPQGPVREAVYDPLDILEYYTSELLPGVKAALAGDALLVPGEQQCRFCPALAVCPAVRDRMVSLAQAEFSAEPDPAKPLPAPSILSNEQLGGIMLHFDELTEWMAACRAYAQGEIQQGRTVPGWKLVAKRANRHWRTGLDVLPWVIQQRPDLKLDDLYTLPELKSPAQIEKAVGMDVPEQYVERLSTGLTLAVTADSRPEVKPAADEFQALPDPHVEPAFTLSEPTKPKRGRKPKQYAPSHS